MDFIQSGIYFILFSSVPIEFLEKGEIKCERKVNERKLLDSIHALIFIDFSSKFQPFKKSLFSFNQNVFLFLNFNLYTLCKLHTVQFIFFIITFSFKKNMKKKKNILDHKFHENHLKLVCV